MKKKKLLVVLFLITLIPMTLFAQRTVGSYGIRGFAGTGMPLTPDFFKDYWKGGGIGYGGEFIYNFSESMGLGIRFHHLPFPLDSDKLKEILDPMIEYMIGGPMPAGLSYDLDGFALNTNIISANLLYYLTPPEVPVCFYLTGGVSYYQLNITDLKITVKYMGQSESETIKADEDIDDKFGFNIGAGAEFNAGDIINIFVEGRYQYRFGEEEGPDFEGEGPSKGSISFISIIAGVNFSLF